MTGCGRCRSIGSCCLSGNCLNWDFSGISFNDEKYSKLHFSSLRENLRGFVNFVEIFFNKKSRSRKCNILQKVVPKT